MAKFKLEKYNLIYDTPMVEETLSGTKKADAFIFDAAGNDDPDFATTGNFLVDNVIGFQQGKDVLVFVNTNYAIPGVDQPPRPTNQIQYNNDPGGTPNDWDSEVWVYDQQNNPVNLTHSDIYIL
jgi:hypothetical protein